MRRWTGIRWIEQQGEWKAKSGDERQHDGEMLAGSAMLLLLRPKEASADEPYVFSANAREELEHPEHQEEEEEEQSKEMRWKPNT